MALLKDIALFFISPLALVMTLAFIALGFLLVKRYKPFRIFATLSISVLVICSQPYTAVLLLYPLEYGNADKPFTLAPTITPDLLYAPACYYDTEGYKTEVSNFNSCSLQRLVQLVRLKQQFSNAKIVVTGGNFMKDKEVVYAQKAHAFLTSMGISEHDVIAVDQGTTTLSEVSAIAELLNNKTVIAVSSATHKQRLLEMLQTHTADAHFYPVDYMSSGDLSPFLTFPSEYALEGCRRAFYEYLAQIKWRLTR